MRRKLSLFLLLLVLAALLAACASGGKAEAPSSSAGQGATTDNAGPMPSPATPPKQDSSAPTEPGSAPAQPMQGRKLVLNAKFQVKVDKADDAIGRISQSVRAAGGYVQQTQQTGTKEQGRSVSMVLRVPAGQYTSVVELVRGLGEVIDQNEWTNDVTEQYVDLEARIKSKQIHLEQLQKLYDKGGSIKEMMELEQEVNRVQSDLESLLGRMRVLSDQVDFSTITVNMTEPGVPTPIQPPKTVWERVKRGFTDSWNGMVNFTGNMVVVIAVLIPVLLYFAVLAGIGFGIYLVVRRQLKRRSRPTPPPPGGPGSQEPPQL